MRIDRGERIREAWCRAMDNEAIHDDEERGKVPSTAEKVAGGIEMAAGVAIAAAGVPMMVLPGPGAAALLGGAALASKGQRRYSGREATAVEEKLDQASVKAAEVAKREGAKAAKAVARNAPKVAAATAKVAVKGGAAAAKAGGRLAGKGLDAAAVAYLRYREQKRGDAL